MKISRIVLFMSLVALPSLAMATEADFEKAIARGVAGIESGDHGAAVTEFRQALNEHPDDPQATLYLAIALNRLNDPAAEEHLKRALRLDPANPRVNLELGNFYLQHGIFEEARDFYEQALRLDTTGELSDAARSGLDMATGKSGGSRWGARLMAGGQFDDNVALVADGAPLPVGMTRKTDWRGVFNAVVSYTPVKTGTVDVTATYGGYQSLHVHLSDYDLTQNQLDLTVKYALTPSLTAALAYSYDFLLVGGNDYAANHTVTSSLTYTLQDRMSTLLAYRYRDTSYKNSALFSTNSIRSGAGHQVSLIQKFTVGEMLVVRGGFSYNQESAEKSYWSAHDSRLQSGVTVRLPFEVIADASGEYSLRQYQGSYPAAGAIREDTGWNTSMILARSFGEHFSLMAGYYYSKNDSNIAAFSYTRSITSVLATVRF